MNDLYRFFSISLAIVLVLTLLWPINWPLMRFAYRIWLGNRNEDQQEEDEEETGEIWKRAAYASLSLFLLSAFTAGICFGAFYIFEWDYLRGILSLVLLSAYLPAAAGLVYTMFGLADFFEALGIVMLYLLLPGLPLALLASLLGLFPKFASAVPWLISL